ncbi:MAG TPA: glycoside hydrolase family 3 N-terminal domain-containing protein [Candidatus Limnocylindria bacterium]|nr:glycoside hydrolase family 3 N-terminal domain-containing protein [Candidatus Limnocylindria bacterium]
MKKYFFLSLGIVVSFLLLPFKATAATIALDASWAEQTLSTMTLEQKIGQLFMVAAVSDEQEHEQLLKTHPYFSAQHNVYKMDRNTIEQLISNYHIGGIIFLSVSTPEKQIMRTKEYQNLSKIPLLIAQDLESGISMPRLHKFIQFPTAMTLGALQDEQLIYDMAYALGKQAQELGVHCVLGPVVDVNNNPENPVIHNRSFGQDPVAVARKGILYMQGLHDAGIISCAKHFPGHGDTATDSHLRLPCITHSREQLDTVELHPFKELIKAGVPTVMVAHLEAPALESQPGIPVSLSPNVVTELLKKELGFTGLVMPDGLGMQAVLKQHAPGDLELAALLAGHDILLCPVDVPKAVERIQQALADGRITQQDLNNRVLKILRAKAWACTKNKMSLTPTFNHSHFYKPDLFELKKRLYQDAVTLVRNDHNLMPVKPDASVSYLQVGGKAANNCANLLYQQGITLQYYVPAQPMDYHVEHIRTSLQNSSTIIISICDMNKAKESVINGQSNNYGIAARTQQLIELLQKDGKNIIILLFGSPYSITLFKTIPAVIMAYEDDPDAQEAAAQVLLGIMQAQGQLPVTP